MNQEEKIIHELSQKPAVSPEGSFQEALYFQLQKEMVKAQAADKKINFNFMNRYKIALGVGLAAAALLLIVVVLPKNPATILSGSQEISQLDEHAFGALENLAANQRNQSGGGGPVSDSKLAVGMGGGTDLSFAPVNYKFKYTGEAFTVDQEKMSVYERQGGFGSASFQDFFSQFDLGLFNLNKFANATLDYVTASETRDFGYTVSLDLRQGLVNISENGKWMTPDRSCADEACFNQYKLKPEEIPGDDQIIAVADAFLNEYGINHDNYGAPVIQDNWRLMYSEAADKSTVYIPDVMNVVYPSKIGENEVYDQGGLKSGMNVSVNLRQMKVSGVWELSSQRFGGSEYETEQDTAKLIQVAEAGGYHNYIPFADMPNVKTQELELGNPMTGFVRLWQTSNGGTRELFVPSLIFPVKNAPADSYLKNLTVPLIKDILNSVGDSPQIMR